MKLLTRNNDKLKDQFIFDLPVSHAICGRQCPGCYALKAQKRFPAVLEKRKRMLLASKATDFVSTVIAQLSSTKSTTRTVRIHSSGEFYSQQYISAWHTIATALPHFTFYAFTKRLADFDFSALSTLPNFILINSLQHGGLNYAPRAQLRNDIFICPATAGHSVTCGITCRYCMTKQAQHHAPQFVKH